MEELIGWGSALILLPTFGLQTYKQWKNRDEPAPASALWFFILALVGTGGQFIYSWMIGNWVYLALNGCLAVNNGIGLAIAMHRRPCSEGPRQSGEIHLVPGLAARSISAVRRPDQAGAL